MELNQAIRGRRATRAFSPVPISRPVVDKLIDAAIQAPSAGNEQPWHFTVVQNLELLDRISEAAKADMVDVAERQRFPSRLHENMGDPDFHVFYHAPTLIVISARRGTWAHEHAALAAQNLMLTAYSLELASCWIGFAQRWISSSAGISVLGIPADFAPVAPIIVGHPVGEMAPVPRRQPLVRWIERQP